MKLILYGEVAKLDASRKIIVLHMNFIIIFLFLIDWEFLSHNIYINVDMNLAYVYKIPRNVIPHNLHATINYLIIMRWRNVVYDIA